MKVQFFPCYKFQHIRQYSNTQDRDGMYTKYVAYLLFSVNESG